MKKFRTAFAVLALALGILAVPAPAQADNYPWYGCNIQFETTYKAYYYSAGGYWVAAANWLQYGNENSYPNCNDINVQLWNTGNVEVRTQVCPASGSCYSMGWGSLIQGGTEYGVTLHDYHMPCGGACAFQFRIETRHWSDPGSGVAENVRIAT
jgi:hypothetical protein